MISRNMDLEDIFANQDSRRFFFKFDQLVSQLTSGGHDVNLVVQKITETLIQKVSSSDFKYEISLYKIPWAKYLFVECTLNEEIFARFLQEYVQIFPNRCEKFMMNFMFVLRGNSNATLPTDTTITERESKVFGSFKSIIEELLRTIQNFERIMKKCLRARFPFFHNTNTHEFVCYIHNYLAISELFSHDNQAEMLDQLFVKAIQLDYKQFFDEINHCNKENVVSECDIFELEEFSEDTPQSMSAEQMKKLKVLDVTLKSLFDLIDQQLASEEDKCDLMRIFSTILFQRLLVVDSVHLQYVLLYLCANDRQFCDHLVNDLWTVTISGDFSLAIRENSFYFIISLLVSSRFIHSNTIFSFLKIILQWMNQFLDNKSSTETLNDNDVMYLVVGIGFCQLFCAFHAEFERIQINCLKNMDMKRAILNNGYNLFQYLNDELCDSFVSLVSYYRIGYNNLTGIRHRSLSQLCANHRESVVKFGPIYLSSVKSRVEGLLRNADSMWTTDVSKCTTLQQTGCNYRGIASSGPTTTTSDEAMTSPPNGSTPFTSLLINHMLSDVDMND